MLLFCTTILSQNSLAESELPNPGEFAIGIAAIAPNGLTAKLWLNESHALDAFGEWAINSKEYRIHLSYLIHDFTRYEWGGNPAGFYYGVGARMKTKEDTDTRAGVRIPIGLNYYLEEVPVELFGEATPWMNLVPSTSFGMDVMIGARYRFKASP